MNSDTAQGSFSPHEIGLLTVVERRGSVRMPRAVDKRNDPTNIERLILLRGLALRGLLLEAEPADDTVTEIEFTMTEAGRAALAVADGVRPAKA
jgi:hypothetical protein